MPLESTAEQPLPVRTVAKAIGDWVAKLGRVWVEGQIAELAERGELDGVIACEARPLLQGARLTVWELVQLGIAHELIVDAAAAGRTGGGALFDRSRRDARQDHCERRIDLPADLYVPRRTTFSFQRSLGQRAGRLV